MFFFLTNDGNDDNLTSFETDLKKKKLQTRTRTRISLNKQNS